jgi:transposase
VGRVSHVCRELGISRDSYYRIKKQFERKGKAGLQPTSRRGKELKKLQVPPDVERKILEVTQQYPEWSRYTVASAIKRVGPSGVQGVWARHELTTRRDRLARYPQTEQSLLAGRAAAKPFKLAALKGQLVDPGIPGRARRR